MRTHVIILERVNQNFEGQTGFLVEKNDAEELANALLVLLKDDVLREAMGRAGKRRAFQHSTWFKVAKQMHARYDEMLSVPRKRESPS
jgi:glycosyltransferase involved in cell wall biosynthesis